MYNTFIMNTISKTQENLLKAYAGESMARNKYTTFAKIARKEGLEWVARIFEETADNERVHAEEEFELIDGPLSFKGDLSIKDGKTLTGLILANKPSFFLIAKSPCSGRILAVGSLSYFGEPIAPKRIASDFMHNLWVLSG